VNTNEIELKCLTTNLSIAKKWARNASVHIARVLLPIQLSSAFFTYEDLYQDTYDVEIWNPPPPPIIKFIQIQSQSKQPPAPKSDKRKQDHTQHKPQIKKTMTYKSVTETENHTITTVNTQDSYIQDTISNLQNTSQQHQQLLEDLQTQHQRQQQRLEEQTARANESDITLQNHVSRFNSRLARGRTTSTTKASRPNSS
jgi:hypothetical protein